MQVSFYSILEKEITVGIDQESDSHSGRDGQRDLEPRTG